MTMLSISVVYIIRQSANDFSSHEERYALFVSRLQTTVVDSVTGNKQFCFSSSWRCEHIDFSITISQSISLYVVATSLCSPSLSLKLVLGPGVPVVPKTAEILFEIVAVYELRHH